MRAIQALQFDLQQGAADLRGCLLAAQTHSLVQQLGHLLIVGVVLAPRTGLDEAVVLQLLHCLLREALQPINLPSESCH